MAYVCLHELHMLPSDYLNLSREERAFIIASFEIKWEIEEKQQKELERKSKSKSRGR